MTELDKTVTRRSKAKRYEKSKSRSIIVSLEASQEIGVRLEGTRQTYRLGVESVYELAVRVWVNKVEKRARELKKTGMRTSTAQAQAKKELSAELS